MPKVLPIIMLIDDDPDFIEMNQVILESKGYRVVSARDAGEALEQMAKEKPAVVITDLMMETLDSGFSFSRQIKSDPRFKDVPIIILTSVTSQYGFDFHPRSSEELAAMSADAFFEKPIPVKALLEKVEELLHRSPVS
jgi:CheY-like chemotaxis protein